MDEEEQNRYSKHTGNKNWSELTRGKERIHMVFLRRESTRKRLYSRRSNSREKRNGKVFDRYRTDIRQNNVGNMAWNKTANNNQHTHTTRS